MRCAIKAVVILGVVGVLLVSSPVTVTAAPQINRFDTAVPACRVPVGATPSATTPGAKIVKVDARTDESFTTRFTAEGTAQLIARAGDLQIEKTVNVDGTFTLTLTAGDDHIVFTVAVDGIEIRRGGQALKMDTSAPTDEGLLHVSRFIAGSRAIRMHHILAASFSPDASEDPAAVATLLTDAFLSTMAGDPTAVERLGQAFAKRRGAIVRKIAFKKGCYTDYEREVSSAWDDYERCMADISRWNPLRNACAGRWIVWAESAWFRLISCSAIPID